MVLKSTHGADDEDVERGRKHKGEHRCSGRARPFHHQRHDRENDADQRGHHGCQLGTLAERRGEEERVTGEAEAQEDVDDENQDDACVGENPIVPDQPNNDPCRKVCYR